MRKVLYSMNVSLDGFVEGPNRELDWSTPDEELHRFWRRLYELMAGFWPTADADPSAPDYVAEFARIWRDKPKVVFSTTLETVDWNSRLVRDNLAEEVAALKAQPGNDMEVGGPTLASTFMRLGLIDEFRPVVHPIVLGAGTPFFPPLDDRIGLRLLETRTLGSGVVYLRYRREPVG